MSATSQGSRWTHSNIGSILEAVDAEGWDGWGVDELSFENAWLGELDRVLLEDGGYLEGEHFVVYLIQTSYYQCCGL